MWIRLEENHFLEVGSLQPGHAHLESRRLTLSVWPQRILVAPWMNFIQGMPRFTVSIIANHRFFHISNHHADPSYSRICSRQPNNKLHSIHRFPIQTWDLLNTLRTFQKKIATNSFMETTQQKPDTSDVDAEDDTSCHELNKKIKRQINQCE